MKIKNYVIGNLSRWSLFCLLISITFQISAQERKPMLLDVKNEAYVLRCFASHNDKVKSHAVAVGDPTNIHYLFDSDNGTLLKVWKGEFVDVAPMWINRGGGFFKTSAETKDISDVPVFAMLSDKNAIWPDSATFAKSYKFKGYKVDKTGRPTFSYSVNDLKVEDKILPTEAKDGVSRELSVTSDNEISNLYVLLAEGTDIKKSSKNTYTVAGKNYTLKLEGKAKPIIRESNGREELLLLVNGGKQANVKYTISL